MHHGLPVLVVLAWVVTWVKKHRLAAPKTGMPAQHMPPKWCHNKHQEKKKDGAPSGAGYYTEPGASSGSRLTAKAKAKARAR
jgi:hypothetical protein